MGIGWLKDRDRPSILDDLGPYPMRVPPRLLAVLLFVVVGMLALVVAGLLDWVVGSLFLAMEFLGEFVRSVFRRRRRHRHPPARSRRAPAASPLDGDHHRGSIRRRSRPRRRRGEHREEDTTPSSPPVPVFKVLVPVSGDEADLLDFALGECRVRQAELIVLFLRPLAVTPMGPNPLPGLAEDEEARATFDRVGSEAERAGVPFRSLYELTADRSTTIGEVATTCAANVVVVGSTRKSLVFRLFASDPNPALIRRLPEHASLMIHAS